VEFERKRFNTNTFSEKPVQESFQQPYTPKKLKPIAKTETTSQKIPNPNFPDGTKVRHAIFGDGVVLETSIMDGNEKVEIDFGTKGKKSLLLKFAKLEIRQ
jgi:DNA helicase-2/ATP-dependent DNA helicase PcrA